MKIKWIVAPAAAILGLAGILFAGYLYIADYTLDRFAPNTWINGIYCTGKTIEEVERELLGDLCPPVISVVDLKGEIHEIDLAEAGFTYSYLAFLGECQQKYSGKDWLGALTEERDIIAPLPDFYYDVERIKELWYQLPIVQAETKSPVLRLTYGEEGYALENTLENHLDVEKGLSELVHAVNNRSEILSLKDKDCYFNYAMDESQKMVFAQWQDVMEMENCGLTYDFGAEKIVFDQALMSYFIAKDERDHPLYDENGELYYDKEKVVAYITNLCEAYHTIGVERNFQSSRGDIVKVEGVTYGTEIDTPKEAAFLWDYLSDDEKRLTQTEHTPAYIVDTPFHGLDDIGGTYVEVDMTQQKLYFYLDYELQFTTDIVTGNLRTKHGTPEGVNAIYKKQRNRVLRGPGYASFVKYWMPFYQAIGLHDASWRDEFGGEIYKTGGSHGCVNIPEEYAAQIYEKCDIGTPVIVFY